VVGASVVHDRTVPEPERSHGAVSAQHSAHI
jgi:hypothetical protein